MKYLPILMSAPMVRAILDGRKTQTRRVVKPQPREDSLGVHFPWASFYTNGFVHTWDRKGTGGQNWRAQDYPNFNKFEDALLQTRYVNPCPYGAPGDRLWVREGVHLDVDDGWVYDADGEVLQYKPSDFDAAGDWVESRPARKSQYLSIHVPRVFSRLTLEVVKVRVERVRDISEADAVAESFSGAADFFHTFFDLNKRAEPDSNPWVWVVEFNRVEDGA